MSVSLTTDFFQGFIQVTFTITQVDNRFVKAIWIDFLHPSLWATEDMQIYRHLFFLPYNIFSCDQGVENLNAPSATQRTEEIPEVSDDYVLAVDIWSETSCCLPRFFIGKITEYLSELMYDVV